ncbi:hypothetical protein Tco_1035938 [Tanacetum coccineum]
MVILLPNHEEGEWVNSLVKVEGVEDLGKVGNQGNVGNQNGNVVNENVQENVGNVLVNGNRVVLTRWIEKMEYVQDMSGCSVDQKVKYTASSFVGKALTWCVGIKSFLMLFGIIAAFIDVNDV